MISIAHNIKHVTLAEHISECQKDTEMTCMNLFNVIIFAALAYIWPNSFKCNKVNIYFCFRCVLLHRCPGPEIIHICTVTLIITMNLMFLVTVEMLCTLNTKTTHALIVFTQLKTNNNYSFSLFTAWPCSYLNQCTFLKNCSEKVLCCKICQIWFSVPPKSLDSLCTLCLMVHSTSDVVNKSKCSVSVKDLCYTVKLQWFPSK